jgi:hypothetical protein
MMRICLVAMLLGCAAAHAQDRAAPAGLRGVCSVTEFGAKGDGVADDTTAFQKALDASAAQGGGQVLVPAGRFLIKTHLSIPAGITLKGVAEAPPRTDTFGSVLLAVEGKGKEDGAPFISMNSSSTIKGLTIVYPEQSKEKPVPYPWCVRSLDDQCSIVNVLMLNPWQAVDFGSVNGSRHYVQGLYGQPIRRGIYVDRCYDIGRISDVHFWPFWTVSEFQKPVDKLIFAQGESFIFGRTDWEYVTNCFSFNYHVGFRFIRSASQRDGGGGNALITQSGADNAQTALLVEETQSHAGLSFLNAQLFGDIIVRPTNEGMIRFTGCGFFGSLNGNGGTAMMRLAGRGRVSFDNCSFYCLHPMNAGKEMIIAESGRLSIENCQFLPSDTLPVNPVPIVLEPNVVSAIIVGNEFNGAGKIVNHASGQVKIAENTFDTERNYLARVEMRGTLALPEIRPGTEAVTLVPNGDFHSGLAGWKVSGDMFAGAPVAAFPHGGRAGSVAFARPGIHNYPNGVLSRSVRLKPDTDYVLSVTAWNLRSAKEWSNVSVDVGAFTPGEMRLTVGPGTAHGDRGYFLYGRFNTGKTGQDVTVRAFFDGPTRFESGKTVTAQWANIALTEARRFRPPAARSALARRGR